MDSPLETVTTPLSCRDEESDYPSSQKGSALPQREFGARVAEDGKQRMPSGGTALGAASRIAAPISHEPATAARPHPVRVRNSGDAQSIQPQSLAGPSFYSPAIGKPERRKFLTAHPAHLSARPLPKRRRRKPLTRLSLPHDLQIRPAVTGRFNPALAHQPERGWGQ